VVPLKRRENSLTSGGNHPEDILYCKWGCSVETTRNYTLLHLFVEAQVGFNGSTPRGGWKWFTRSASGLGSRTGCVGRFPPGTMSRSGEKIPVNPSLFSNSLWKYIYIKKKCPRRWQSAISFRFQSRHSS
jgi:hypothetical protein